jgi:DNA-binding LacI/PurR family transcriptional regulator
VSGVGTGPGQDPVTLRAVAAYAGVSKSLVSRVLQDSPHVSADRRNAVQRAIRELGYRPNTTARSLTQRRTRAIGVLVNDLRQPWFVDFLEGLNPTLHERDLHAFVGDGRLDRATDERLLRAFMEMRVDGLVLAGSMTPSATITEAASWLPTVAAGSRDFELPHVDVIAQDDLLAASIAMEHLYGLGHRLIGHVAGHPARVFELRQAGYESFMTARGLTDHIVVQACDTTEQGGYRATMHLLDNGAQRRPTALLVANDLACVGAMAAVHDLGLAMPGDVSLVGFDNSSLARLRQISMTSVDVAAAAVGERSALLLTERIANPSLPARERLLTPRLDVRNSTAAPRDPYPAGS